MSVKVCAKNRVFNYSYKTRRVTRCLQHVQNASHVRRTSYVALMGVPESDISKEVEENNNIGRLDAYSRQYVSRGLHVLTLCVCIHLFLLKSKRGQSILYSVLCVFKSDKDVSSVMLAEAPSL